MSIHLIDLTREDLISLITEYDKYIKETCEDEQNIINKCPVCINEYLNNEFLEKANTNTSKVISFADEYADIFTETSADIMNVFEDVLGEHNLKIPDKCREGNEDEAMIYGETYYEMESLVEDLICKCTEKIYNTFNRIPIKEVDLDGK